MDAKSDCYILTVEKDGDCSIFSLKEEGSVQRVVLFQERDDAERYVIMLEQDEYYSVGNVFAAEIQQVCLGDVLDILNEKGHDYLYIKNTDLFIPPPVN